MKVYPVEVAYRRVAEASVHWQEWSGLPFGAARQSRKGVLLFLTARWSAGCAAMERLVFADPAVVALVRRDWIAVRVDADQRPDINERYNLGGWPTIALLTPEGEILSGGTFLEVQELISLLERSREAVEALSVPQEVHGGLVASPRQATEPEPEATIDVDAADWLVEHLLTEADAAHGGFGEGPKYPMPAALGLLLARYRESADSEVALVLTRSLDAICEHLYDEREGGFFRYAAHRDWTGPSSEKLVAENARLMTICLEAATLLDSPHYRARAMGALSWIRTRMVDTEHGGFFASERADHSQSETTERVTSDPGSLDRTLYADVNAEVAGSLLIVGDSLDDPSLVELALSSLERVVLVLYRPGAGLAHYYTDRPHVRGLLVDQVRAAWSLVTAARLTGRVPYVMLAEELMQYARRTLWDQARGGFFDRSVPVAEDGDIGLLAERIKPLDTNCEAARALAALATLSERAEYGEWARQTLASQTLVYRKHGAHGAAYGLAALELAPDSRTHPPLS